MDFIKAGLKDHNLAIQCHVAGERFPVDIIAKALRNLSTGVLVKLLGKVCSAQIFASIIVECGARVGEIIAKMVEQLSAELAMVLDKISKLAHRLEACVFGEVRPFEAFVMSGNRSALPPTRPLRTVLASFPAHGSSKSLMSRAAAVGVDET